MKDIIKEIGWPTASKVGKEAAHMAWLLVQHADHDPAFQCECLALLKNEPLVEVSPSDIGYLEDRVRVNTKNLQLYGTQFYTDEAGVFGPRPIEDPEHLNERRSAIQLGTFEEYRDLMFKINGEYDEGQKKNDSTESKNERQAPHLRFASIAPNVWKSLGELPRTGWVRRGVAHPESVQEHIVTLREIAYSLDGISEEETDELIDMLEIHDWPEAIHGDEVILTEDVAERKRLKDIKFINEKKALESICEGLGKEGQNILRLWLRFEANADPSAQLANQIDKYQAVEKAFIYEKEQGISLFEEFYNHAEKYITHPILLKKLNGLVSEWERLNSQPSSA